MEKSYKNIGFVFLLLIPMAIIGFYKSYIIKSPDISVEIDAYVHVHAFISAIWVGLLITQPLLIRYNKYNVHRIFGKISYVVFPLLILSFIPLMARKFDGIASIVNPFFDVGLLLIFYPLALRNINNIAAHMRYMISVVLIFIGPTFARILFHWTDISEFWGTMIVWGSINALLSGLLIWDKINNRNYKPYIVAQCAFLFYLIVLFLLTY